MLSSSTSGELASPWDALPQRTADLAAMDSAIVGFRSRDERSRPFNLLRSQLTRLFDEGRRIVGVTSATPHVGKTFLACNLAASLSRLPDRKTVLLDLDLRRASVAERFGIAVEMGLSNYLNEDVGDLDAISWGVEGQQLWIYPTKPLTEPSSEILSGHRFQELVAQMRSAANDTVFICDLPPVFANDDAMIISELVDGFILVVENGVTTRKQVQDALRLLGSGKCLGTVLNRFAGGLGGGTYGFGYGGGGSYSDYYA